MAALPLSCGNRPRNNSPEEETLPAESPAVVPLHAPDSLNDVVAIFSGLQVDSASAWHKYTESAAWKKYAATLDSRWKPCKEGLDKVDAFARDSLADIRSRAKTVFYPFSGPDLLYPITLFPDADTIITAALEPIGAGVTEKSLNASYYQKCLPTLSTVMRMSYFITKSMKSDLGTEGLGGVTPVQEFFLVRLGYKILSVDADKDMVVIRYFKPGEDREKVLRHFRVNLADKHMSEAYTAMVESLDPASTVGMIKSCSYMLHRGYFSQIRDYLLTKTFALVQDDTGVRYANILGAGFDVTLFGRYSHPLRCFEESTFQKDLEEASRKAPRRDINFRYGYNGTPLLMVARKN